MRAYHNCTTLAAPVRNSFAHLVPAHVWTESEKAAYTLKVAQTGLASLQARYVVACASLGAANRMKGYARRRWQAEAFRFINITRRQLHAAHAALAVALRDPALASDQAAA